MDDIYFLLEEIGYELDTEFKVQFIDTGDVYYAIERLNMILVTNEEPPVTHGTYGEYLTVSAPLIAVNNRIVAVGEIPDKNILKELVKEAL